MMPASMSAPTSAPMSFARHVHRMLRPYRLGIPLALSLLAGLTVAVTVLVLRASSDLHLIQAVAPHLSTLVETQDQPEILRMLSAMAKERQVDLLVVKNGLVMATSRSPEEMDRPFEKPTQIFRLQNSGVTPESLFTSTLIKRENGPDTGAEVVILSPLQPILFSCLLVALAVLCLSFLISHVYSAGVIAAVRKTLRPIEIMDEAIRDLIGDSELSIPVTGIHELDNIRSTIIEARRALVDATDRMAEAKSKELTTDSYRRLIHDLYTPIAALRERVKQASDISVTPEKRENANQRVLQLAEQILSQVSAAKENIQIDSKILTQSDVRKCITDAAEQSLLAFARRSGVKLHQRFPDEPVLVPHDSENLRRAVSNLVSNALRASRETVEIALEKHEGGIIIRVSDDGSGISPDDVALFLQGRLPSKDGDRPGFGLPSANHIARLHGGRLVYRKSPLGGACFEIRM